MDKLHKQTFLFQCKQQFKFNDSQINQIGKIIDHWNENSNMTIAQLASYLGQCKTESANTFGVIREFGAKSYFKYLIGKLGIRNLDEAYRYRGWGRMQTTGRYNFRNAERLLEEEGIVINLEQFINDKNRDQEFESKIDLIVTFKSFEQGLWTGKKIGDYVTKDNQNYAHARRVVNPGQFKLWSEYVNGKRGINRKKHYKHLEEIIRDSIIFHKLLKQNLIPMLKFDETKIEEIKNALKKNNIDVHEDMINQIIQILKQEKILVENNNS